MVQCSVVGGVEGSGQVVKICKKYIFSSATRSENLVRLFRHWQHLGKSLSDFLVI